MNQPRNAIDPDGVSVVIPTRGRPDLVVRAIGTALDQGSEVREVIVVVDGPDPVTVERLESIPDTRVRVHVNPAPAGGGNARNRGVRLATGRWVAFLDDDDEWFPGKISAQLIAAATVRAPSPIVLCRVIASSPGYDEIWPRRLPYPGEPLSDYLYARRSPLAGEGFLQTSTILAPRELVVNVPFDERLRRHQDHDWALRAAAHPGTKFAFADAVLVRWHRDEDRSRISSFADWRYSLRWARSRRAEMTRRSYAALLIVHIGGVAARTRDLRGVGAVVNEAIRSRGAHPIDFMILLGKLILPAKVRRFFHTRAGRRAKASLPPERS